MESKSLIRDRNLYWLFGLGLGLSVISYHFRLRFPFDDTFISFRYAEHLASGMGLVWNTNGPHCEGYTNFLFIVVLAGLKLLNLDLLSGAQVLGLICTILTGALLYCTGAKLGAKQVGLLACILYFATPLTWVNALSGMETSFFIVLCTASIALFAMKRVTLAFVAALLATLTRPEAGMLGLLEILLLLRQVDAVRHLVRFVIAFVIPLAFYAIWKYTYFGYLLPNSFYVKVLHEGASHFPGLQYVRLFVTSVLILIAAACFVRGWKEHWTLQLVAAWASFLLLFYIFVLPLEGLYDRFLLPALGPICLLSAAGLWRLSTRYIVRYWISGAVLAALYFVILLITPRTSQSLTSHEELWDASMDKIVAQLRQLPHSDSLSLAYGDAGYVVYKSGIQHLDLFGLNDTRIAHAHSIAERKLVVIAEQPDLLMLPVTSSSDSSAHLVETAYGSVPSKDFIAVAQVEAFPYPLLLFVNSRSRYSSELTQDIRTQTISGHSLWRTAPNCLK